MSIFQQNSFAKGETDGHGLCSWNLCTERIGTVKGIGSTGQTMIGEHVADDLNVYVR